MNGIEIVQTFCLESDSIVDGLTEFKKWIYSNDVEAEPRNTPNMETMDYEEYVQTKKAWFKYKVFLSLPTTERDALHANWSTLCSIARSRSIGLWPPSSLQPM